MRILFYITHPAKYHLFKNTINELKKDHNVDIIINSKDVLEELVQKEEWGYTNLFPKGRNVSWKPSLLKSSLNFLLTLIRLEKYLLKNNKYDVFVTSDSLVVNGWWRRIPNYLFVDNDIETIKFIKILFYFADVIISPDSTNLGSFNKKKIGFKGNKALAHIHPNYFKPSKEILKKYDFEENKYCIIRVAKLNATHDIEGNTGISNSDLEKIIYLAENKLKILIVSERDLPNSFNKFVFKGSPQDLTDLMSFSQFFIGDSGTMAMEAAILGVPNILINKLAKNIGVHKELKKANLQFYFDSYDESHHLVKKLINDGEIKQKWLINKYNYIEHCDDLNKILIEIFTNHSKV